MSIEIFGRLLLESRQGRMLEPRPDLGLPTPVVAFNGGLEAGFSGRNEDRDHAEAEAGANDLAQGVGPAMCSMEPGVVVELNVAGQAKLPPMLGESLDGFRCRDEGTNPRSCQSAVKGDRVEHLNVNSAFDDKAGDDVDAIEFGSALCDRRQVPAAGRRRMTDPASAVESPSPKQDSSDSSDGRRFPAALLEHFPSDCCIPELSQSTFCLQLLPYPQDLLLGGRVDSVGPAPGPSRSIRPIHSVKSLLTSSLKPAPDRPPVDSELFGNRSNRSAASNRCDHLAALPLIGVFFPFSVLPDLLTQNHLSTRPLRPSGNLRAERAQAVEADGLWKADEYAVFPHPLENAARFPHLPQPQLTTR